jgi:ABC-type multidrug transport system ATPase subunit
MSAAEARARTDEVLERFRLADVADRRVSTYSGAYAGDSISAPR